ncbi:hypothetical protein [Aliterella atlantica]|uniref:hypothetical protein n=1 Tax=Aliterella atlantica TaxID=1827278 RepID=UPI001364C40E|nr:hypothetical protein [Aliterella atlantica]
MDKGFAVKNVYPTLAAIACPSGIANSWTAASTAILLLDLGDEYSQHFQDL